MTNSRMSYVSLNTTNAIQFVFALFTSKKWSNLNKKFNILYGYSTE